MKLSNKLSIIINHLQGIVYDMENYESKREKLIKVQNKAKTKHSGDKVDVYELQIEMYNIAINDLKEKYNKTIDKLVLTKFEGVIHNVTE
jgi:hypothetical protein